MYFEGLDLPTLLMIVAGFNVYFMPWFVALLRVHHRRHMIGLLNLMLGWTLIGWLIAFLWATGKMKTGHEERAIRQEYAVEGRVQKRPAAGHEYSKVS